MRGYRVYPSHIDEEGVAASDVKIPRTCFCPASVTCSLAEIRRLPPNVIIDLSNWLSKALASTTEIY